MGTLCLAPASYRPMYRAFFPWAAPTLAGNCFSYFGEAAF